MTMKRVVLVEQCRTCYIYPQRVRQMEGLYKEKHLAKEEDLRDQKSGKVSYIPDQPQEATGEEQNRSLDGQ